MKNQRRSTPILPDGSEIYIAAVVSLGVGLSLFVFNYPMWAYVLAAIASFMACFFGIRIWTENDRMYVKGEQQRRTIESQLAVLEQLHYQVRNQKAQEFLASGIEDARSIVGELVKQAPASMYGGMSELAPKVSWVADTVPEYLEIQNNPRKAGNKHAELMRKAEEGFEGFRDAMESMLTRTNAGDILRMSTRVELLRGLRNLLNSLKG